MKEKKATKYYENPLITRYSSAEMNYVFSPEKKFTTWRKLWCALARAERELGLLITREQVEELESHIDDIDFEAAARYEKQFRHDVMAHIHTYGDQCPNAKPIIHLGATSAYVGDNTDLIQIRDALGIIRMRLVNVIRNLRDFALEFRSMPTLGFTHFQPAQLTTVGKRASLWLHDFIVDYHDFEHLSSTLRFRGVKGTTGTQASFLNLLDGDHEKVRRLDELVSSAMDFPERFMVTGQTYTRKVDARVAAFLSGICQSASKMANDIRLLAHLKEIEEPFETTQVGSSAMPYKRNPMRCERINSLARYVISLESSPANTAATQWLERTLDDSANKRLAIPGGFLGTDAVLRIAMNVASGLVVYPAVITRHIMQELPFIATENIIMEAVKKGGDRQVLHEEVRKMAHEAARRVKTGDGENDLVKQITCSTAFNLSGDELAHIMEAARYTGRAAEQVEEFIAAEVEPILAREKDTPREAAELNV